MDGASWGVSGSGSGSGGKTWAEGVVGRTAARMIGKSAGASREEPSGGARVRSLGAEAALDVRLGLVPLRAHNLACKSMHGCFELAAARTLGRQQTLGLLASLRHGNSPGAWTLLLGPLRYGITPFTEPSAR